jgi:hypothetical protein
LESLIKSLRVLIIKDHFRVAQVIIKTTTTCVCLFSAQLQSIQVVVGFVISYLWDIQEVLLVIIVAVPNR